MTDFSRASINVEEWMRGMLPTVLGRNSACELKLQTPRSGDAITQLRVNLSRDAKSHNFIHLVAIPPHQFFMSINTKRQLHKSVKLYLSKEKKPRPKICSDHRNRGSCKKFVEIAVLGRG